MKTEKVAIIKILDEVNCVVMGLDEKDNNYFKKLYSPFADNYFFSPKYKLGQWDGRISFYSKGGKTYVNLLDEIVAELKARKYKLKLIDNREIFELRVPMIDKNYFASTDIELGDHQVEAVNSILKNNGGIVLAATGAGKSIINAALADAYNKAYGFRVIIIVPNSDLVSQGVEDFRERDLDVGEYSGDNKDLNHEIVISTWQALQNNPQLMGMFKVAIVDECHGVKGQVLKDILNNYGAHIFVRIGVTGTLPEKEVDALSVKITLGIPQYTITAKQLIDSGWLAELDIHIIEMIEEKKDEYAAWCEKFPEDAEKVSYKEFMSTVLFPDYDSEKRYLNTNLERVEYVTRIVELNRLRDKGNSLILVNSVPSGKRLAELIPGSHFVYGMDKKEFRKRVYNLFKDNDDVVVIATSQLASTGLNIPRIFYLYLLDIGKSYIRVIQSIGRGLRKAHDKNYVSVFDISSNLRYSKDHQNKRVVHYKKAEYPFTKEKVEYNKKKKVK
jgi:superfamily II DNA or RNA helicase